MDGGSRSRLTSEAGNETSPVWSPDGQTVAYMSSLGRGSEGVAAKGASGVAKTLLDFPDSAEAPTDWSPDGRHIAVNRFASDRSPGFDVLVLSVATRTTIDIATTPANESAAVFSPDGRWIAYQSDERGRSEVFVQPFPPTGAKFQISTSGGRSPRWRAQNEITYADENDRLAAVPVDTTNGFAASLPKTLPLTIDSRGFGPWTDYDIAPDGNVLVNARVRGKPAPLTLVTNWTRRLETAAKE
jgi:dipeptidyl aminopeptidase/acylaminoacyl peptidase